MPRSLLPALTVAFLAAVPATFALAQSLYIYPAQGQSEDQMNRDKYECHSWAVEQSGVDPLDQRSIDAAAAAYNQDGPPQKKHKGAKRILGGAAGGAAAGAVIGAIAGDAGDGAAIGATVGGLRGVLRHNKKKNKEAAQQDDARAEARQAAVDSYNRANAACLTGRGYTVQ